MMSGGLGSSRRDVLRLFEGGSVAGLGDGELLERFAITRDEAAFEALVSRLGPMVLGVCRRMLTESHDVDDAFQATFLVLVRRAGSIRDRDLVAPWLHGVATRIARRARADSARRSARERVAVVVEARDEAIGIESEWPELRAMIDEEIERLPDHHRCPVILCDVEGLSREEAALRLGWSLNMVRGRLERARDRLRGRLTRRGLAPSGAWMALIVTPPTLPPSLASLTVRAGLSFAIGRLGAGAASASAVALSEGVLRMMMLSKLKIGIVVLLSTGFVAAGTGILAAQGPGEKPDPLKAVATPAPAPAPSPVVQEPSNETDPFRPRSAVELAKARIDAALLRFKTQSEFYEQGRITVDRLADASRGLMQAARDATDSRAGRIEAIRAHHDRLKQILKREEAELALGRATESDVTEIKSVLLDTEFALAKELEASEAKPAQTAAKPGSRPPVAPDPPAPTALAKLAAERVEIARKLLKEAERLYPAAISIEDYLNARIFLLEAEEKAATTRAGRIEAVKGQIEMLKKQLGAGETLFKQGAKSSSDFDHLRLKVLEAEAHLIEISDAPENPGKGAATTSGGNLPGASKEADRSPLSDAVEAFNALAAQDETGRDQPSLTVEEVIASVRMWKPERGEVASPELIATLDSISESRRWPEGADLGSLTRKFNGKDFEFLGWWVVFRVPGMAQNRGIMVREHLIRSVAVKDLTQKIRDRDSKVPRQEGEGVNKAVRP